MWAERVNENKTQLLLAPIRLMMGSDKPSKPTKPTSSPERVNSHYDYLRELEKQRGANEAIRLMYVACTRAEKQLVLTACAKVDEKTESVKPPIKNSLLFPLWSALETGFEFAHAVKTVDQERLSNDELPQMLSRLPGNFEVCLQDSIDWQAKHQLQSKVVSEDQIEKQQLEFEWATKVATTVGVVMHDWLQFNYQNLFKIAVDNTMQKRWRQQLSFMGVPNERLGFAVRRLSNGVQAMQQDSHAEFLFSEYAVQKNELALSVYENGVVNQYRIDRTFVDDSGIRWIVDYKTTYTQAEDIASFVDAQIIERHQEQLQKYGELMSQIDSRPIKLAVYFPMLSELRSWDFEKSKTR